MATKKTSPFIAYMLQVVLTDTIEIPLQLTMKVPGPFSKFQADLPKHIKETFLAQIKEYKAQDAENAGNGEQLQNATTILDALRIFWHPRYMNIYIYGIRQQGPSQDLTTNLNILI